MLKLIIVDDSPIELQGLLDAINWNNLDIEVVNVAQNGKCALELIEKNKPDILITDIKMPVMDGIELVTRVRLLNNNIKIIFLTAYEDFNNARKGIELNVDSFILKPIRIKDFTTELKKVHDLIIQEQAKAISEEVILKQLEESLPLLRDKFLMGLFEGQYKDNELIKKKIAYLGIPIAYGCSYCLVLFLKDTATEYFNEDESSQYFEDISILNELACLEDEFFSSLSVQLNDSTRYAALLIYKTSGIKESLYEHLESTIERIRDKIFRLTSEKVSVFVGREVSELKDICISFRDANELVNYQLSMGIRRILFYSDINPGSNENNLKINNSFIKNMESKIANPINLCDRQKTAELIDDFFKYMEGFKNVSNRYIQNLCIYFLSLGEKSLFETNIDPDEIFDRRNLIKKMLEFNSIDDIHNWMVHVFTQFSDKVNERRNNKSQHQVGQVINFIEENYNKDISLRDVSRVVYLTPNYIGNIFKNCTGESFVDYLTRVRIEKAKELLAIADNRIFEVSNAVGYSNITYFCTKFKNIYGVSPTEYRELLFKES